MCPCCATNRSLPGTIGSVKLLGIVLAVQVAIGLTLVALVATDNLPFVGDDAAAAQGCARGDGRPLRGAAAFRLLRHQVEMGPRPPARPSRAGSRP